MNSIWFPQILQFTLVIKDILITEIQEIGMNIRVEKSYLNQDFTLDIDNLTVRIINKIL